MYKNIKDNNFFCSERLVFEFEVQHQSNRPGGSIGEGKKDGGIEAAGTKLVASALGTEQEVARKVILGDIDKLLEAIQRADEHLQAAKKEGDSQKIARWQLHLEKLEGDYTQTMKALLHSYGLNKWNQVAATEADLHTMFQDKSKLSAALAIAQSIHTSGPDMPPFVREALLKKIAVLYPDQKVPSITLKPDTPLTPKQQAHELLIREYAASLDTVCKRAGFGDLTGLSPIRQDEIGTGALEQRVFFRDGLLDHPEKVWPALQRKINEIYKDSAPSVYALLNNTPIEKSDVLALQTIYNNTFTAGDKGNRLEPYYEAVSRYRMAHQLDPIEKTSLAKMEKKYNDQLFTAKTIDTSAPQA